MATSAVNSLVGDPMLLPPRATQYCLQSAYELLADGCRQEIVLDWGDCHLIVRVDGDTDTLDTLFHAQPFAPTEVHRNLAACPPWDRLIGKECDWTWVAVNQQGYRDLIVLSFDVMVPQVLLHALASSMEVFTVSQGQERGVCMGHTKERVTIDNVLLVIADGEKAQTVNVCTTDVEGDYRQVYRCGQRNCWVTGLMLQSNTHTLEQLDQFLKERGFVAEGPRGHS